MKKKLYAYAVTFVRTGFVRATLPVLLLFVLPGACFGQVYSYTDVGVAGNFVSGYGAVSGYYNSGTHVTSTTLYLTSPSGSSITAYGAQSASAYIAINGEEGSFNGSTSHQGTCPGSGTTHTTGGSGNQVQVCPDTCTPCRALRESQGNICLGVLVTCQAAATAAYLTAHNACENQNFCQSGNPNYNAEECGRCNNTVLEVYAIASGACAGAATICYSNRVDCSLPTYKLTCTEGCTNP